MNRQAALLLLSALLISMMPAAFAARNIAELRITDITTPVEAGERLDFSFLAGNRAGPACSAQVQYWFDRDGERVLQGDDTIYLDTGGTKSEDISLIIPSSLQGIRTFYLEMECNDTIVRASRIIEISVGIPTMPQFSTLDIEASSEEEQIVFSYVLESNQPEEAAIHVEESIVKDNNVLWNSSQNIPLVGSKSFKRYGPVLPPGSYTLVVKATHGAETARVAREFSVRAVPVPLLTIILVGLLALVLVAATALAIRHFWFARKHYEKGRGVTAAAVQPVTAEEEAAAPPKHTVCLVESEVSGTPDSDTLNSLLLAAGIPEEKKGEAFEVATRVGVIQTVKSCVFTEKGEKMSFETIVTVTVPNNSNRHWKDVSVIARLPDFLKENISEVSADTEMQTIQEDSVLKLSLARIGAMQSASIVYRAPKLISQQEADSIALPAVIAYSEGRKLALKKAKVKKRAKSKGKTAKKAVLKKRQAERKAVAKKQARKNHN